MLISGPIAALDLESQAVKLSGSLDASKINKVGVARSMGAGSVKSEVDSGSLRVEALDVADVYLRMMVSCRDGRGAAE